MKNIKAWKYHAFSLTFFSSTVFFFLTFKKLIYTELYGENYQAFWLFELALCVTLLYTISNIIIIILDKVAINSVLKFSNILIILAALAVLHIGFQQIFWPILQYSQAWFFPPDKHLDFNPKLIFEKRLVNYFYFYFISLTWLVFMYAFKIYEMKQIELKQKLSIEKNLKEANLNTLKGQINPHFIFNSLNNIRGLVQEDPLKTKEMITRLSELLRSSLLSGKNNFVTLREEIETLENFLEISKIQYEERLNYQINIPEEHDVYHIPPMILQMLVENAVKHGISTLINGGWITIRSYNDSNDFHLIVENTGAITPSDKGTQIGIKNIEERLQLLYDNQATFSLTEENEKVIAHIRISKLILHA